MKKNPIMETTIRQPFNPAQLELLSTMASLNSESDLIELKQVLAHFFADRADREMERLWDESEGGKNAGSMISKTFEIGGDYLSATTGGIPVLEHVGGVGDAIVTGTGETIGAIADVGYSGGQSAGASAVIIGSDDHYWDDSAEFGDDADLY